MSGIAPDGVEFGSSGLNKVDTALFTLSLNPSKNLSRHSSGTGILLRPGHVKVYVQELLIFGSNYRGGRFPGAEEDGATTKFKALLEFIAEREHPFPKAQIIEFLDKACPAEEQAEFHIVDKDAILAYLMQPRFSPEAALPALAFGGASASSPEAELARLTK